MKVLIGPPVSQITEANIGWDNIYTDTLAGVRWAGAGAGVFVTQYRDNDMWVRDHIVTGDTPGQGNYTCGEQNSDNIS